MTSVDIKEFRAKGYLQELNRRFLHPLGMAISVDIDEHGNETLGQVWDYRADPEGLLFNWSEFDAVAVNARSLYVQSELDQKRLTRLVTRECDFIGGVAIQRLP